HFGRSATGVAFLDISTGEFLAAEGSADYIEKLMANMAPKEVLVMRGCKRRLEEDFAQRYFSFELDDWVFTPATADERLRRQFGTASLKGFGIDRMPDAIIAAGAALHYLDITQHTRIAHINAISRIEEERYVRMDAFTVRNLEIIEPLGADGRSLLGVLDRTTTPMGARLLRRWLLFPLKDPRAINDRLDIVEQFFRDTAMRDRLGELLARVGDLERLCSKIANERITPREMLQLRAALQAIGPVRALCEGCGLEALRAIGCQLNECAAVADRIGREISDDAPAMLTRGDVIRPGVDAELDRLRDIAHGGKRYLLEMQARESEATGIGSLKIGYNNVFGYYIEVTNTHRDKVPEHWIRKQTLVNAERYITPELKEYEQQILTAQDSIGGIEARLYARLVADVGAYIPAMQLDAAMLARLDVLLGFTRAAAEGRYARPVVDDSMVLELTEARHPVIERELPPGEPYIANSLKLDNESTQIMMITGPNMSGKSALLRQTALNVLMAQCGSFVAADAAHIGVVDKIFTRVGASDNIALGESTFMVEMNEAASILNNMSARSLILFDELGRGTSTYDGISIAWAIVEYIHEHRGLHPKTLFATHYHELNDMEDSFERIVNYNVSVREIDGRVVFLRKLARGGSAHSFGIHVARLAGMPHTITDRADAVLKRLESGAHRADGQVAVSAPDMTAATQQAGMQLSFFQLDDPVLEQVRDELLGVDIDRLTPLQALTKLNDIRSILTGR
ncbi:MAG: DNA mismatch repair protein MutS, partial [Muribaculaceae bacterium]|nr:DNA mismatch repair protein MutS [Muribaculaceae bacterium]